MPLKSTMDELREIRRKKFPDSLDSDDNIMKRPHEHYKDNAIFAVYLYKKFCDIAQVDDSVKIRFDQLEDYGDRCKLLLSESSSRTELEKVVDLLSLDDSKEDTAKNSNLSESYRKSGNKNFNQKNFQEAIADYNLAIKFCSEEAILNQLVANRSAVYFQLKRYEDTLADIRDALELGYVSNLPNLLIRKITSLRILGRDKESEETYEEALKMAGKLETETLKHDWKAKVSTSFYQKLNLTNDVAIVFHDKKSIVGRNAYLDSASNFVKMTFDPVKGRGLAVTRDVVKGEVIIVCKATASVLASAFTEDYCDHCMLPFGDRFLSCSSCTLVKYCSAICRRQAMADYHGSECKWLPVLRLYPNALHALRIMLSCGFDKSLKYSLSADKRSLEDWTKMTFGPRFECFYSLFRKDMQSLEFKYSYPMAAAVYGIICQRMGLISQDDVIAFSSQTMMESLLIISRNADTVFTADWSKIVGSAIHMTSSMFNHSCEPNVHTYYVGSKVVHLARRPLAAGEEIFVSYGVNFATDKLSERQDFLKNSYRFDCTCERCLVELSGQVNCSKCDQNFQRTTFGTMACPKCDVDDDGEFLTKDAFDHDDNSYCCIM
ncbi:SET and MYND domain-containing protein 4 [Halotydeus destructor]|nr:SET and MYND domain-containing protein 4 [Halotydeus destructor]